MKKLILALLLVLAMACPLWAAGTTVVSSDELIRDKSGNPSMRVITITATADAAAATFVTLALNASTAGLVHGSPLGWYGYGVMIDGNHTGTEPTENCDLTIVNVGAGDVLGGQGVNNIDNTTERAVYFHNGTAPMWQPMFGTWTVTPDAAAENIVNSAVVYIYIVLVDYPQ